MFSLSNFELKEMRNWNLLGILSSPVKRLCWWCKHTSSQIETTLLCAVKTGNVLKPIFEQNPSSVFSAAFHRSHLLQHSANCLIQVFSISVSTFSIYEHRSIYRKLPAFENLSTLRGLLYFQYIYILFLHMRKDLQETRTQEWIIKNSDKALNSDSFLFPTL